MISSIYSILSSWDNSTRKKKKQPIKSPGGEKLSGKVHIYGFKILLFKNLLVYFNALGIKANFGRYL